MALLRAANGPRLPCLNRCATTRHATRRPCLPLMRWFRPSTRSRPNQMVSALKLPNSLFRRRQAARLRSLQFSSIPNWLVAASGQPRKVLCSTGIANADPGRELSSFRLDQHRMAPRGSEGADQRNRYTACRVGHKLLGRTLALRRHNLERRGIAPHPQTDGVERVGQRLLLAAMTALQITHVIAIAAGYTGDDQIKAADFFALYRERMAPGQRRNARPVDQSPSLLAYCRRPHTIGHPGRWLRHGRRGRRSRNGSGNWCVGFVRRQSRAF